LCLFFASHFFPRPDLLDYLYIYWIHQQKTEQTKQNKNKRKRGEKKKGKEKQNKKKEV